MKGMTGRRELLAAALFAAFIMALGISLSGTSFAAEEARNTDHFAYVVGYPDGTVRPVETVTREEAAVIFYRLMTEKGGNACAFQGEPFSDVDGGRWSGDEIAALRQAGILLGNPDGSFRPCQPVTRAEFAAMAARFSRLKGAGVEPLGEKGIESQGETGIGMPEEAENRFPDAAGHWAESDINAAVEGGWLRGFGDGTFRPESTIIRCEAMMLINDALDRRVDTKGLHEEAKQWPDNSPDKWYYEIVLEATNSHVCQRADQPKSTERWTEIKETPAW